MHSEGSAQQKGGSLQDSQQQESRKPADAERKAETEASTLQSVAAGGPQNKESDHHQEPAAAVLLSPVATADASKAIKYAKKACDSGQGIGKLCVLKKRAERFPNLPWHVDTHTRERERERLVLPLIHTHSHNPFDDYCS